MACILVIEDDPAIRRGLLDALRFSGHEVLQAATGTTGRTEALRANVDLVLIDLVLPGPSGLDILAAVRGGPSHPARHHPHRPVARNRTGSMDSASVRTTTR
jgi:DNA-binding response OmpR family regulator